MSSLQGKTALITGASRGIGLAIAQRFASEGANLVLVASRMGAHGDQPGTLEEAVATVEAMGVKAVPLTANLSDPEARQDLIARAEQALGPIDILVNNAAGSAMKLPSQVSLERRQRMFELNLQAPIDLAQQVLPGMRERGYGWILNLSSATALQPVVPYRDSQMAAHIIGTYGASKAALNRYTEALAHEVFSDGIFVNTLAPENIAITPGTSYVMDIAKKNPDMVEPVEVMAEAALELCSNRHVGKIAYSRRLLHSVARNVRSLDGKTELGDAFLPADISAI